MSNRQAMAIFGVITIVIVALMWNMYRSYQQDQLQKDKAIVRNIESQMIEILSDARKMPAGPKYQKAKAEYESLAAERERLILKWNNYNDDPAPPFPDPDSFRTDTATDAVKQMLDRQGALP